MTWTLRERGDTGGTVRLEYLCPEHGRFEADVSRASSPDAMGCPVVSCEEVSPWSPSGVVGRVKQGEVVQGKADERPADKYVMDTSVIADGMPLAEFKAKRAKVHRDIALERIRKLGAR